MSTSETDLKLFEVMTVLAPLIDSYASCKNFQINVFFFYPTYVTRENILEPHSGHSELLLNPSFCLQVCSEENWPMTMTISFTNCVIE